MCSFIAVAYGEMPAPDERPWDQVIHSFESTHAQNANDGEWDGRRLLTIDRDKAITYLLSAIATNQADNIRLKATGALGWCNVTDGIPALVALALNETEPTSLRKSALNPGLRYMKDDRTLIAALPLATNGNEQIRSEAYWALSGNGTIQAIRGLDHALMRESPARKEEVIRALNYSENPLAGQVVLNYYATGELPDDERTMRSFANCMNTYRRAEAQHIMRPLCRDEDSLVALMALQYFGSFPNNDVAQDLITYIEQRKGDGSWLFDTVNCFLKSDSVSESYKVILRRFLEDKRVRKQEIQI